MEQEAIAIAAEDERQRVLALTITQHGTVIKCLLHPGTHTVVVVLGLDDCDGDVGLVV
jgi:hypothetical protein